MTDNVELMEAEIVDESVIGTNPFDDGKVALENTGTEMTFERQQELFNLATKTLNDLLVDKGFTGEDGLFLTTLLSAMIDRSNIQHFESCGSSAEDYMNYFEYVMGGISDGGK